jgi:hypothetical protein
MATPAQSRSVAAESPSWPAPGLRSAHPGESGLGPPSVVPRRLVLLGLLTAFAGLACLLAVLVRIALVGFDDPAASGDSPLPSLSLGIALLLGGGLLTHAGSLFVRADRRPR